jgi:hypothetical protein
MHVEPTYFLRCIFFIQGYRIMYEVAITTKIEVKKGLYSS